MYTVTTDYGSKGTSLAFASITAVNHAPVANPDSYGSNEDTQLTGNVLDNDTDDDSNHAGLRARLLTGPTHAKSFSLNADGSFSYVPNDDFESSPTDTFTYVAHDGLWTDGSTVMSPDSGPATVTITVVSRHTITDVFSSKNPSVYGDTVTFTAIVTPVSPQLGTPTGTVTFKDGAATLGTGTLSGGSGDVQHRLPPVAAKRRGALDYRGVLRSHEHRVPTRHSVLRQHVGCAQPGDPEETFDSDG